MTPCHAAMKPASLSVLIDISMLHRQAVYSSVHSFGNTLHSFLACRAFWRDFASFLASKVVFLFFRVLERLALGGKLRPLLR